MADWISSNEADFNLLLNQYAGYVGLHLADLGVTQAKSDALAAKSATYFQKIAARNTYEIQGAPIYQALRDAKEALVAEWRGLDAEIMARRETTNEQRAALGRSIPDSTPTAAGVPTTRPLIVRIESPSSLTQVIHWTDENTPGKKAKPPGVKRAILFLKVGTAPATPDEMQEIASDSATPYMFQFEAADAGKTAHWSLCWEANPGQRGPRSPTSSWTIPG